MGIGRREFLVEFGGAIAMLASAQKLAATVEDLYVNRKHGFAFRKPSGWTFGDVKEITANLEGMVLDFPGFDQELWAAEIRADDVYGELVVVMDTRREVPVPGYRGPRPETYGPILTVRYEGTLATHAMNGETPENLTHYANIDIPLTRRLYKNFRMLKEPRVRRISGCEALEFTCEHLFEHVHMPRSVMVRERALYIHQDPAIYSVRMADYPSFSPPLVHDYDEFIESIRVL